LPTFVVIFVLEDSHSSWAEMKSYCSIGLHFFNDQRTWTFFHIFIGHLCLFLWKFCIQFMCSFLHWLIDSLGVKFFEVPVDSGCKSLIRWIADKDFSLILWAVVWVSWLFLFLCRSFLVW
jgi:hypothetical protein